MDADREIPRSCASQAGGLHGADRAPRPGHLRRNGRQRGSAQAEAPRHPKESTADYPRTSPGKASAAVSSDAALISHSAILRGYVHASLISRRGSDREQRTGEKPRWSPTISTSAGRDHSIAIGIVRWATAAEQSTRQLPGLRVPANGRKRSSATSDVVGGLAFLDRDVHEVPPFGP